MTLQTDRRYAIDVFRGLTIFTMIFVNVLAGVGGVPEWMKHAAADADAMTFVDVVFPAFLFVVGMSIPFALHQRKARGEGTALVLAHVALRSLGLIVLGTLMVNAEGGYSDDMISIHAWSLIVYGGAFLVWGVFPSSPRTLKITLKAVGIVLLLVAAISYRSSSGGPIEPRWWGILGLIGWAYLISTLIYLGCRGNGFMLLFTIGVCLAYYYFGHLAFEGNPFFRHPLMSQGGHATHIAIVISGIVIARVFYRNPETETFRERLTNVVMWCLAFGAAGYFFRSYFGISKIFATPSWGMYCALICTLVFALLYWMTDIAKVSRRPLDFFIPASINPLFAYLIPFVIYHFMRVFDFSFPGLFHYGVTGIVWSLFYAMAVMMIVRFVNRTGFRLAF